MNKTALSREDEGSNARMPLSATLRVFQINQGVGEAVCAASGDDMAAEVSAEAIKIVPTSRLKIPRIKAK